MEFRMKSEMIRLEEEVLRYEEFISVFNADEECSLNEIEEATPKRCSAISQY